MVSLFYQTLYKSWRSVLIELLGCIVILSTSLMAVASRDSISAGMAGLSISYSLQVSTNIWLLRSKCKTKPTVKNINFYCFLPSRHINVVSTLKQHCLNDEMTLNTFDFVIDPTSKSLFSFVTCHNIPVFSYLWNKSDCEFIACLGILTLSLAFASIIAYFYFTNRWQK